MKRLLFIVIPLLLVGGTVYGMMLSGIPPFKKDTGKKSKAHAAPATEQKTTASSSAPANGGAGSSTVPPVPPVRRSTPPPRPQAADANTVEMTEARIARLSTVYEQMPAEEAGRIFAKLPDPLVEELLRRMDERQVGKLLLALDVGRAARLTQSLAMQPLAKPPLAK